MQNSFSVSWQLCFCSCNRVSFRLILLTDVIFSSVSRNIFGIIPWDLQTATNPSGSLALYLFMNMRSEIILGLCHCVTRVTGNQRTKSPAWNAMGKMIPKAFGKEKQSYLSKKSPVITGRRKRISMKLLVCIVNPFLQILWWEFSLLLQCQYLQQSAKGGDGVALSEPR